MGGESSKPKTIVKTVYVESDESKRARVLSKLENQLEQLKEEVVSVELTVHPKECQGDCLRGTERTAHAIQPAQRQIEDRAGYQEHVWRLSSARLYSRHRLQDGHCYDELRGDDGDSALAGAQDSEANWKSSLCRA